MCRLGNLKNAKHLFLLRWCHALQALHPIFVPVKGGKLVTSPICNEDPGFGGNDELVEFLVIVRAFEKGQEGPRAKGIGEQHIGKLDMLQFLINARVKSGNERPMGVALSDTAQRHGS